ncbi:MAG: type III-B CRISPR module RAMP protein Cmr1 [Fibrobacter sp.]|nr:type III-B CRISPR module RAMP protein Cmr1 [Fibrobacter sp.]
MRKTLINGATLPPIKESELISKAYEFKLISPMFGGDTESFVINKNIPIRSQSVKGQLRFWWRTMQGESDSKRLLERECCLWGGAFGKKQQSRIKVSVTDFRDLAFVAVNPRRNKNGSNDIAPYVLFPIMQKLKNNETVELLQQATFTLTLTFPKECKDDAMNSLLLWMLFGGVGGRTRRGCGSVYSAELMKDMEVDSMANVKNFINKVAQGSLTELDYARLKGAQLYCCKSEKKSVASLQKKYGDYRQQRNGYETSHPGRSYWPEPDSIRAIFNKYPEIHRPEHPDGIWFPRAVFGLPVAFEFRGEHAREEIPGRIELLPVGDKITRWPSTCIMKLIQVGSDLYEVLLVLNQKFPSSMRVKTKIGSKTVPPSAMPSNTQGKIMVKNPKKPELELKGRTIFKALADALNLKEVNNEVPD